MDVAQGRLRGEILETVTGETTYCSFKGIPYAKPPVGPLRFKVTYHQDVIIDYHQPLSSGAQQQFSLSFRQLITKGLEVVSSPLVELEVDPNLPLVL